jgi:hypothetical protein
MQMNNDKSICFYVAANGSDQWSGKLPQIDNTAQDGPFATLKRAIEETRIHKDKMHKKIIIREGNYYDAAVELTTEDSGLTIEAMPGEKPVLYGGRKISGWKKEKDSEFWYAELPEAAKGYWDFRMLSVDGRFCSRARLPENGRFEHLTEFKVDWLSTTDGGWARKPTMDELTTMTYNTKDLGPWLDIKNAELTIFHKWDESMAGIASHDVETNTFRLSNSCGHPPGAFGYRGYVVWNVREGLKAPGQWYLDRTFGRVVYWPMSGEDMEKAEVVAPTGYSILNFSEKVSNVVIKGLTFSVANTSLIAANFAAIRMPGAVQSLHGLENCLFSGLTIKNTAGHGIKLEGINKLVRIEGCEVTNTGAGGIFFYNNLRELSEDNILVVAPCPSAGVPSGEPDCIVSNNLVHNTGLVSPSAIAIATNYCNVLHNEVMNTTYSGISGGGGSIRIEHNIISKAMQVLNDGAAIYVTFCKDGTICGNIIRDIQQGDESDSTKNAIYLDEQAAGWMVEGNLVVNCTHPTMNHMAQGNTLKNNTFVSDSYLRLNFIRCKDYKVEQNILYSKGKIIFAQNEDAVTSCGSNIFYSVTGEYEVHLINEKYRHYETTALKAREGTHFEDPLFTEVDGRNYDLRENSPALMQGIKQMEYKKAGRIYK